MLTYNFFSNKFDFNKEALEIFRFQSKNNKLYNNYLKLLKVTPAEINSINKIPFLPISFYKSYKIKSFKGKSDMIFESSGTTADKKSKHYVKDIDLYESSFKKCFTYFYSDIKEFCILALLPGYIERKGSSLIYMTEKLIKETKNKYSGFFINNYKELDKRIKNFNNTKQKVILLGVSHALLDFSEKYKQKLSDNIIVMETGGTKGKSKDITKTELHKILCKNFSIKKIHSEYGMTELFSQAYSKGDGIFYTPTWMKILVRDLYDPFTFLPPNLTGGINIIDLANINTCSFIETEDIGKLRTDGSFEVLGRTNNSHLRGCNLLI